MTMFTVKSFWDGVRNKELIGNRCNECGKLMLPPRPVCQSCHSTDLETKKFKGTGAITTKTKIFVALPRYANRCPHGVAVVRLNEGVSISGLLLEDALIGDKVEAVYVEEGEEKLLAFQKV